MFKCVGVFDPIAVEWSAKGCEAVILSRSEVNSHGV